MFHFYSFNQRRFMECYHKRSNVETTDQLAAMQNSDAKARDALGTYIASLDQELENLGLAADDFGIVLPVSEILSVNIFSEYVYQKYFARPRSALLDS